MCLPLYIYKFQPQANLIYLSLVSCPFLFQPGLCPYGLQKRALVIIISGITIGLLFILIHIQLKICCISPLFLSKHILYLS